MEKILMIYNSYSEDNLSIKIYPNFLSQEDSIMLFNYIINNAKFDSSFYTLKGVLSKRRIKSIYGSIPYYKANYHGIENKIEVNDWNDMQILKDLADKLSLITKQVYHVCVIQFYSSGEVGINPHRDKEMKEGTIITSLSLGSSRIMKFERGDKELNFELNSGTLCLIEPPTNDCWLHSISKDSSNQPRMSLIFRNCEGM